MMGNDLEWHEDPNWWASKNMKGIGLSEEEAEKRKYMSAGKMFKDGIRTVFGGKGVAPSGGGGGGGTYGAGGNGTVTSNGGPGMGASSGPVNVQQAQVDKSGLDDKARVEILKVKQALQRHMTMQHIPPKSVIAGGVFVSLFHNQPINDIDVFVLGAGENDIITLPEMTKAGKYTTYENFQNYTGRDDIMGIFNDTESKFQYIYTKARTPRELLEGFDFVHCCCAYYDEKLWINGKIYDAIQNKWLIPNIERSMIKEQRKQRFLERGFVEPGDLMNLYNSDKRKA